MVGIQKTAKLKYPVAKLILIQGSDYTKCVECSKNYHANSKKGFFGRGIINSKNDPCKVTRIGLLGEMAFSLYTGLPADMEYRKGGKTHDFDANGISVDIKTASRDYGAALIRYKSQRGTIVLRKPADIYIGAFLSEEDKENGFANLVLVGWFPYNEFKEEWVKPARVGNHTNYELPFSEAKPMDSLCQQLQKTGSTPTLITE